MRISLTFDVSAGIGSGETLTQTAWAFLPEHPAETRGVLLCLAGGTYDKHYWHIDIEGHPGYSFGEHLAAAGFVVIAVDHLGIGDSTDPLSSGPLGLELLAKGNAEVARQVRERLRDGNLHEGLPPVAVPVVGVGHSMGACLTTMVQATARPYDAVALLGYGVQITNVYESTADAQDLEQRIQQTIEVACQITGARPTDIHTFAPRSYLVDLFYAGEVPQAVVDADTAAQSRVPVRAAAEVTTPGMVERYAPLVDVPVFLGFGAALDVSPNPYAETANYTGSSDVTLYLVPKSGHCHNFASHRGQLWDRIAKWLHTVVSVQSVQV
ncbi:alpha/beta hydrolase [Mycolicibacterium peregrinum]|uniref:alpha/beta fold hydrolase n=1 Tax=Mycolicibacterium TaxID=1866885 RepID=UPI0006D842F2|nr:MULTISPECIES: alpha/beta hydrolase [Mycolicibacterium]MCV7205682.1 alpha/beta hydrolase [Mycolicibacterium peregrinum]ODR27540.1 alpha/beta hydrolase [Mycolicibacterium porcinum]ORW62586.1 alpha/beta hydrolase [Mycolicibacterium peregrinum]